MTQKFDPYATLGVPHDADEPSIRRAYRRAAKHAHPDGGGTQAAFGRLTKALAILTNPRARHQYDQTGEADEPGPDTGPSQIMVTVATAIFTAMAQTEAVETVDLIANAKQVVHQQTQACRQAIAVCKGQIAKIERVELRIRRKKRGGDDFLKAMIVGQIQNLRRAISMNEDSIKINAEALVILDEYEYNYIKPQQSRDPWSSFPFLNSRNASPW